MAAYFSVLSVKASWTRAVILKKQSKEIGFSDLSFLRFFCVNSVIFLLIREEFVCVTRKACDPCESGM